MERTLLAGRLLEGTSLAEGFIMVEGGVVVDSGRGPPPGEGYDRKIEGVVVPGLLDAHTHLGDHGARGDLPQTLPEAMFPGGSKHMYLDGSPRDDLVRSYGSALEEVSRSASVVLDFREGGLEGISIAREASVGTKTGLCLLGRPHGDDTAEEVLDHCDGIGAPSLACDLEHLRGLTNDAGKLLSVHASESFREDISVIADPGPDLVIHMVKGTAEDWKELSSRDVPICVCPRSNGSFSIDVPIEGMRSAGCRLLLGTDNAMSSMQDMFREMEAAWVLLRRSGYGGSAAARAVLDMATGRTIEGTRLSSLVLGEDPWTGNGFPVKGHRARVMVLRDGGGRSWTDPASRIVRFSSAYDVLFIA